MILKIFGVLAGAAVTTGLMLALLGGGHASVLDPVAQAASTTASAGPASFDLTGSVTTNGKRVPLNGHGTVDLAKQRARMSMSLPVPMLGSVTTDAILDGQTLYVHVPPAIPIGKPWLKADFGQIGKRLGFDPKQQATQVNPADALKALEAAGKSRKLGSERVAGVNTTHYRTSVDPKFPGVSAFPIDVWIDASGRVRQESTHFAAAGTAADLKLTFNRFGGSVDATPPASDQVMDAGALLGAS